MSTNSPSGQACLEVLRLKAQRQRRRRRSVSLLLGVLGRRFGRPLGRQCGIVLGMYMLERRQQLVCILLRASWSEFLM